jgi:hypothetical protein
VNKSIFNSEPYYRAYLNGSYYNMNELPRGEWKYLGNE